MSDNSRMASLGERACYYCGMPADGPDDHVPPEVLFRGISGRNYKSPPIIKVPSCVSHNQDASAVDETLAWILSDAGARQSNAAMDVYMSLLSGTYNKTWRNPKFVDRRLAHIGCRILRNPDDYDNQGRPKPINYDEAYVRKAKDTLRQKWSMIKDGIKKIAAGIYYFATAGSPLGTDRIDRLTIVAPDFKQIGRDISFSGLDIDEDKYFESKLFPWKMPSWHSVVSGSPDIFQCKIAANPKRKNWLAMSMVFYGRVRIWITLDGGHKDTSNYSA